jgi:PAS domain S-box-containing protein
MHVLATPAMAKPAFWDAQESALLDALAVRSPATAEPGFRQLWSDLLLLRTTIETSPICVTLTDMTLPDQPLAFVNPAFERMTGYAARDCVGRNCRFLQGPATDPEAVGRLRSAISAGQPADVTLLNHRRDGTPFWNRVLLQPVRNLEGRLMAYVGHQLGEDHARLQVSPLARGPGGQLSSSESQ